MDYAPTNHIGQYKNTRRNKTKKTASATGGVCIMDAKTERCRRNSKGQAEIRTVEPVANGFLKTKFLPKLAETEQPFTRTSKLERDFYKSLSQMAQHYQVETMVTKGIWFPYNIALSLSDIKQKLQNQTLNCDHIRLVRDKDKMFFISEERYNTGTTLFYIPVVPLYLMLKDKQRNKTALLLLSVCSYLYHIADIPYYRQANTYLNWQYEMLSDWMEEDEESRENESYSNQFKQAESIGDCIEKRLYNVKNLDAFENRLKKFRAKDGFEKDCYALSTKAFELYSQYPYEKYSRYANVDSLRANDDDEDYDENDTVNMDMYISFYAHSRGSLADNLYESLNQQFGEMGKTQEPVIFKSFDGSTLTDKNLHFEEQLFGLMDNLIYLLNTYNDKYYE
jgi:hypothetical protein